MSYDAKSCDNWQMGGGGGGVGGAGHWDQVILKSEAKAPEQ